MFLLQMVPNRDDTRDMKASAVNLLHRSWQPTRTRLASALPDDIGFRWSRLDCLPNLPLVRTRSVVAFKPWPCGQSLLTVQEQQLQHRKLEYISLDTPSVQSELQAFVAAISDPSSGIGRSVTERKPETCMGGGCIVEFNLCPTGPKIALAITSQR